MPFADTLLPMHVPVAVYLARLAQVPPADAFTSIVQVGAVGAVLVIALFALRAVYQQQIATLKDTVTAERTRADRTEAELIKLNEAVRDRLLGTMASSAETFKEALRALEGRR